jgi:hypothetical protein
MGWVRNEYRIVTVKPEGKRLFGTSRYKGRIILK